MIMFGFVLFFAGSSSFTGHKYRLFFFNDGFVLGEFFISEPPNFFRSGIQNLAVRWKATVINGGEYILDLFMYFVH